MLFMDESLDHNEQTGQHHSHRQPGSSDELHAVVGVEVMCELIEGVVTNVLEYCMVEALYSRRVSQKISCLMAPAYRSLLTIMIPKMLKQHRICPFDSDTITSFRSPSKTPKHVVSHLLAPANCVSWPPLECRICSRISNSQKISRVVNATSRVANRC